MAYICKNENDIIKACNLFVRVDKKITLSVSKLCKEDYINPYLKLKDGEKLKGTDFYHLYNFLKTGIKCPRVELALSYSNNWNIKRLKKEGLINYLSDITK